LDEKKRGGAIEHFYITTVIIDDEGENIEPTECKALGGKPLGAGGAARSAGIDPVQPQPVLLPQLEHV
jgi:hypothetical protein